VVAAQHAVFYVLDSRADTPDLTLLAGYGSKGQGAREHLELGEGLVGQCAIERQKSCCREVPIDYITISSGLGAAPPQNIPRAAGVFEDR
jgi:hypothetical protein